MPAADTAAEVVYAIPDRAGYKFAPPGRSTRFNWGYHMRSHDVWTVCCEEGTPLTAQVRDLQLTRALAVCRGMLAGRTHLCLVASWRGMLR